MTPKEKANELVEKFYLELRQHSFNYDEETSKQCALICVDEIQNTKSVCVNDTEYEYWEDVKHEIELL